MKYTIGIANSYKGFGGNNFSPVRKTQVGKVYGVVTTKDTPTKAMFEKVGGFQGIGMIFYLDYDQSKGIVGDNSDTFLETCKVARPLPSTTQHYPLLYELVSLEDLPSPTSQVNGGVIQRYYTGIINLWGNNQQNSQPTSNDASLGLTFSENPNIRSLLAYEGDHIIQGRQGSAIRFSTTTKLYNDLNEWSSIGNDKDPITVLTNGFDYDPLKDFYTEQINKDASSIYLTSKQKIFPQVDKSENLNNLTNPKNVSNYIDSQVIINADRVTLNSKKDEVMIFAKTNVEINTKNTINLNADTRVHLNSKSILLGPFDSNHPPQPLLLGTETGNLFVYLIETLAKLANYLSKSVGVAEGSPIIGLNTAGGELFDDIDKLYTLLEKIPSKRVLISPNEAIQTNTSISTSDQQNVAVPMQASFKEGISQQLLQDDIRSDRKISSQSEQKIPRQSLTKQSSTKPNSTSSTPSTKQPSTKSTSTPSPAQDLKNVDIILLGGLDYRSGDKTITEQIQILKDATGGKDVLGFRYTEPSKVKDAIGKYPNAKVVLFSAGGSHSSEIALVMKNKKNLYIVEPFAASENTATSVQSAVSQSVPSKNVITGPKPYTGRGYGVVKNSTPTPDGIGHWGALKYVGTFLR
jgi:hypothetical protein